MHNIVLDENISYQYMSKLQELWYTVHHISDLAGGISDDHVLHIAASYSAVLVTQDSDFGHLIYRDNFDHQFPIIFLRDKTQNKRSMFERLIDVLKQWNIQNKQYITINKLGVKISKR